MEVIFKYILHLTFYILRTLTWKIHHQIKLQGFRKVWIWTFEWLVQQIYSLNKVCTPHFLYPIIGFWQGSFVWKCCAFNFNYNFEKIGFKVNILSDCHISQTKSYFKIFLLPLFRRIYALSVGFKNGTSTKKRFPVLRQKPPEVLP